MSSRTPKPNLYAQMARTTRRFIEEKKVPPARFAMQGPGTIRERTPGMVLHRVRMRIAGRGIDRAAAAATFAHQPWAKSARYIGASCGWHVFERSP